MSPDDQVSSTQSEPLDHGAAADAEALLRRHAPILRFDDRELFFPTEIDTYVATAGLWVDGAEVAAPGSITADDLDHRWGVRASLRWIYDDDLKAVVKEEASRLARKLLSPRLGRVGLFGRILDALFIVSVFVRPTTPRRTTPAAALKAERLGMDRKAVCYGRVQRAGEWLVLHYSYFYVMNDWRTGYRGLNDHEADWEQAWIFLDPADRQPRWVAASSHDYAGADLRRHWADPEVIKEGDRPVLHAGAGSHALFFRPGDYVTRLDVPALRWLLRLQRWSRSVLRIRDEATERGLGPALGAPFVESAVGDGRSIEQWDLRMIGDDTPWASDFRGLWGLDTGDPMEGERGPSGPKFDREGDVRVSWADPIGFVGLHGTPPPSAQPERVNPQKLERALDDVDEQIRRRGRLLPLAQQIGEPERDGRRVGSHDRVVAATQRAGRSRSSARSGSLGRRRHPLTPPASGRSASPACRLGMDPGFLGGGECPDAVDCHRRHLLLRCRRLRRRLPDHRSGRNDRRAAGPSTLPGGHPTRRSLRRRRCSVPLRHRRCAHRQSLRPRCAPHCGCRLALLREPRRARGRTTIPSSAPPCSTSRPTVSLERKATPDVVDHRGVDLADDHRLATRRRCQRLAERIDQHRITGVVKAVARRPRLRRGRPGSPRGRTPGSRSLVPAAASASAGDERPASSRRPRRDRLLPRSPRTRRRSEGRSRRRTYNGRRGARG